MFRPVVDLYESTPNVEVAPELEFDDVEVVLGPEGPPTDYPQLDGYAEERTAVGGEPGGEEEDPVTYQTYGVFLDWSHPDRARSQEWLMTFEGIIPGTSRRSGNIQTWADPDPEDACGTYAEFHDRAATFCSWGVCGFVDCEGSADRLVILDQPAPLDPETTDCSVYETREGEVIEYRIREAFNSVLVIEPVHDNEGNCPYPLPTPECFPYAVSYEIRAAGQWIMEGQSTGFLHQRTVGADGRCAYESYVASCGDVTCDMTGEGEDPLQPIGWEGDSRCLLTSRVREGEVFANPFFCLVVQPGLCGERAGTFCDDPDEVFPTVRDSWMRWSVRGGFREQRVEVGSLPGVLRFNPGDGSLYAIDRSDRGLVEVDLDTLRVIRNYL